MLRLLSVTSLELLVLLGAPGIPPPSTDPWANVDCSQNAGPGCDLGVGTGGTSGGGGTHQGSGGGAALNDGLACRYEPVDYHDPGGQAAGQGGWYMVLCSPDGKDPLSHGPVWIPAGAGAAPALSPAQLAQIARKRLRLPEPQIAASPAGDQLVNLPTWLWLSDGWRQVSASASVPGMSVTAVANLTSVSWSMGDGGAVECASSGTPYQPGDARSASPDCGYTYRYSSAAQPQQAFAVMATVRWSITWSGAGQSGAFPGLTTSATTTLRVAEVQALGSG